MHHLYPMITIFDGPAVGQGFNCRRAPNLLRVAWNWDEQKWDALDLPEDQPLEIEDVYVYEIIPGSRIGPVHVCIRGEGRDGSGWYEGGVYRWLSVPDGDQMHDNYTWRQFVADHFGVPLKVVLEGMGLSD